MNNVSDMKNVLRDVGLNDNEIRVYLELLKVGNAPASVLGKHAKMSRSTVKYICERLHKRNIIRAIHKNNAVVYSIESPEKLLYYLDRKQEFLDITKGKLSQYMGFLKNMQNPHAVIPKVQFFDGLEGIDKALTHVVDKSQPGDTNYTFIKFFPEYKDFVELDSIMENYIRRRVSKGVRSKIITCEDPEATVIQSMDEKCLRETRITKRMVFDFPAGIIVGYANCVCFLSIEDGGMFGVTIESSNIYQMLTGFFKIGWQFAGEG